MRAPSPGLTDDDRGLLRRPRARSSVLSASTALSSLEEDEERRPWASVTKATMPACSEGSASEDAVRGSSCLLYTSPSPRD